MFRSLAVGISLVLYIIQSGEVAIKDVISERSWFPNVGSLRSGSSDVCSCHAFDM